MTITVLLAPDGSVVARLFGKKTVRDFFALIAHKKYVELRGTAFFLGESEPYVLAPGYRLEHRDLAELLARPTAADLQAAVDSRDRLFEQGKRLINKLADRSELCARAYREGFSAGMECEAAGELTNIQTAWLNSDAFHALEGGGK